jgi:hypothetical protein
VMLKFAAWSVPVLPIHDSFRVHHAYEADLRNELISAYRDVMGKEPLMTVDLHQMDDETIDYPIEFADVLKWIESDHSYRRFGEFNRLRKPS